MIAAITRVKNNKTEILKLIDEGLGISDAIQTATDAYNEGNNFWNQANITHAVYENLVFLEKKIDNLKKQIKRVKKLIPKAKSSSVKKQMERLLANDQTVLSTYEKHSLPKAKKKFDAEMSELGAQGLKTAHAFDELKRKLV